MIANIVSEIRKATATSLWWILALCIAGYMAMMAAAFGWIMSMPVEEGGLGGLDPVEAAKVVYGVAPSMGYVFPLVVGALAVTAEYRHRTITATFLAEPRRERVLGAKLVAQFGVGALYGVVGTLAAVVAGAVALSATGGETALGEPEVWATVGWSVVALAVWGMVGVGMGAMVPNQVASIVIILAFTQFVEPIARSVLSLVDAGSGAAKFLPGAAGEALAGGSFYSASGAAPVLDRWEGGLVLVAYAVAFCAIGWFTTLRRDVS